METTMIGIWSNYSSTFLYWFAILILIVFALPMLFVPLVWAKTIRFTLPEHTDLAVYFGRSLGVAAIGICVMCFMASKTPAAQAIVIDGLIVISALYVVTHIHGAIKKIQPLAETLEIGFWIGLFCLLLAVYPIGSGAGLFG
jgi:hypothetical protein